MKNSKPFLSWRLRKKFGFSSALLILAGLLLQVPASGKAVVHSMSEYQNRVISGTISDVDHQPLLGITVLVKGTSIGAISDAQGKFRLDVPPDAQVLVFSFVGMKTIEEPIANRSVVDIVMEEDIAQLEEVVVIGYGTQKKVNLTGSIATINAKSLDARPITNSSQAFQGVQGIYVNQAGGQPGKDMATIRVRGLGTIGGSSTKLDPLVLVDGVEYQLSDVNPRDIETISVLKDAASAAIYGSRAANGVILITTKTGTKGKSSIEYSNYFGAQEVTYLPDVVDNSVDFLEAWNTAMINSGRPRQYSEELIQSFRDNPTSIQYPNTNWFDEMFEIAPIQEHNLRFSGGTDNILYNLSLGFLTQEGVLKYTSADRYNFNLRVSSQLSKRLNVEGAVMGTRRDVRQPYRDGSGMMSGIFRVAPTMPIQRFEDGRYADTWVVTPGQNEFRNPDMMAREGKTKERNDGVLVSLSMKYNILEGLDYQMKAALNNGNFNSSRFWPLITIYNVWTGEPSRQMVFDRPSRTNNFRNNQNITFFNNLVFNRSINTDHVISGVLGYSYETFKSDWFEAYGEGFQSNYLNELGLATTNYDIDGSATQSALMSYFGRVQYSFMDRYLMEGNFRYDGSSRFSRDNRWGLFPSFSLGWRISEESFMQDIDWLSELKFRGSWGQIGNQDIGLFQYVSAVELGSNYAFGGNIAPGAAVVQSRDPMISWETTTMRNVGLDWALLNGKVTGSAELFHKRTDGILRSVNIPSQVGDLTGPTTNVAVVDNTGYEIGLNHVNRINSSFAYEVGGQLTKIKNEVVDTNGEIIYGFHNTVTMEGHPIESWYIMKTDGLFQTQEEIDAYPTYSNRVSPGDVKYVDLDSNGVINLNDRYVAGSSFPKYTYGFNTGITVKNFQFTTFWQGVLGINTYPDRNLASPFYNGAGVTKEWLTDAWTPENTNAPLPRLTSRNQYPENFLQSDYWLKDASYLRLKNIQLSYSLSNEFLNKAGIAGVKIFVNGQNLLTISKFKIFDPERNILGRELYEYPSVKMYTMGLNLSL